MSEGASSQIGWDPRFVRPRGSNEQPGVTCAPIFDVDMQTAACEQHGSFDDADGRLVRAYDDVVLLRDVLPENDADAAYVARAGSTGTVLFFSINPDGVALIELNEWGPTVCVFEDQRFLKLHMTNEEKYPR